MKKQLFFLIIVLSCLTLCCSKAQEKEDSPRDIAEKVYWQTIHSLNLRDSVALSQLFYPQQIYTGDSLSPSDVAKIYIEGMEQLVMQDKDLQVRITFQVIDFLKVSNLVEHEGLKYIGILVISEVTIQLLNDTPAGRKAFMQMKKTMGELRKGVDDVIRASIQDPNKIPRLKDSNQPFVFSYLVPENWYVIFDPTFGNWRLAKPTIAFPSTEVVLKAWGN
ncbi:MAG: hypothetical protein ACK4GN_13425 [Runella sp.]